MVEYVTSPDWTRDLIVYEIATRTFTSPEGPGSGTFASMQEKIPYLQELGINAIWLTGHSLANEDHFYNIWTQYACIEPDKIDPALGTEADFKALINSAHAHGIRVFLDVITHGVMDGSPLIDRHPHWFRGESWGMRDFDFDLRDPELDQWWVDVWTRYIVEFGVDGYRLDLGMRRPDLWQRVRDNAKAAGRSIILINELNYAGSLEYMAQSELSHIASREDYLKVIDFVQRDDEVLLDPHHKRPHEVNCAVGPANMWDVPQWDVWLSNVLNRDRIGELPPWAWSSVQLSCHDDGWEDFSGKNPYVAQGSRFIFGYGALFSGMVPIFMAGEEFNAPYYPLPTLSPHLFGGERPGEGTWLYGGVIQWDALQQPVHQTIFEDVKTLINLRKQEADVLGAVPNYQPQNIRTLIFKSDQPCPTPYIRWNSGKAILIAGNMRADADLHMTVMIPLSELGLGDAEKYRVTDLWTNETSELSADTLTELAITVPRDKISGGGLCLLKIEPIY